MKIGIDCRLRDETGVGRYIRNLVLNLQKIDKKNEYVLFVLYKDMEEILKLVRNNNFRIVEANVRWHTVEEQLKFPRILKRENLDLVHFPYFSVPVFYNSPFVVTIHDLILNHYPTGQASTLPSPIYNFKLLAYKFIIAQAAKKSKKIITVSHATKKEILDHLGVDWDKVAVTYEGVENSKSPTSLKLRGASKILNTKYFLYVGNAYPHKNLERLLEAFDLFCHPQVSSEGYHDIKLVLVGKEDYFYKRLKKKVEEMKLSEKVIFLQNISDGELADLYRNALALILPSLMEGFGLPVLEAMSNKCLVLASNIPSLKEICGDAALYFNPLSIDDLADKLNIVTLHTTEYEGLQEIRRRGIERAKIFSWQKMARETLKVYQQAVPL